MTTTTATEKKNVVLTKMQARIVDQYNLELTADGLVKEACSRCGGSGSYSFCQRFGTRCFQCNVASGGSRVGWQLSKLKTVVSRIRRQEIAQEKRQARIDAESLVEVQVRVDDLWKSGIDLKERIKLESLAAMSHFGQVGNRGRFTLKFTGCYSFENNWGGGWIYKFSDESGSEMVWFTSSLQSITREHAGQEFTFKATVKKHDWYGNKPQTIVTRVALPAIENAET